MDDYNENRAGNLEDIPTNWKRWFRMDREHSAEWREEAEESFDFVAGRQWTDEDEAKLKAELRPVITFNRSEVIVDAISGNEILSRNEVRYIPREQGDAIANELYTEAARWYDDEAEAEDEDSEAFRNAIICGMGWTESRLDFDTDPEGEPQVDVVDSLEMFWDCGSRKANLIDARRLWRVRAMTREEAEDMFPGVPLADLDAGSWIDHSEGHEPHNVDPENYYENTEGSGSHSSNKRIRVIHLQYWEWEDYYRAANPFTGELEDLSVEDHDAMAKNMQQQFGVGIKSVKQRRKKYKQAFVGRKLIQHMDLEAPHFTWNCITGKRDRNKNIWYGVIRAMKDPQRWANKWLSQMLHIINSNSKGGLIIEKSAADGNIRDLEKNWAKPDAAVVVADGAITGGKIQQRPAAQFPAGYQQLTEFAIQAIRDVTGVSLEMLGMREVNQPGVLEHQRKQAGMAVLAQLFNSLRRYRKRRGQVLLYYIHNFLSDNRLVRIVGEEREQYVPLMKQAATRFDVIVDESPTSPNQKEQVWGSLMQILPGIKDMVPPEVLLQLLDYSPLPGSVVQKIKDVVSAPDPQVEEQKKIEAQAALIGMQQQSADVQKTHAETEKIQSETVENQTDAMLNQAKVQTEVMQAQMPVVPTQLQ